jgi:ketosteroid isomerase-like protein
MKKLIVLLFVAILLTACGPAPQSVANSWVEALNKGDIDSALSYLAEDAVVTISPAGPEGDAVFTGHTEIRGWYETIKTGKGITTLSNCKVDGETITCNDVYADEGLKSMGVDFLEGEWVATIKDGKIQSYTFTTSPESLAKLAPPPEPTTAPTAVPALPPTPAAVLSPEAPISSIEDVIGIWGIRWQGDPYRMEFKADGFFWVGWEGNRTALGQSKYAVEGNQLHFLAQDGSVNARYEVYVTKQDGKPVLLRFVLVGEDADANRKESLDGKTLKPYVP